MGARRGLLKGAFQPDTEAERRRSLLAILLLGVGALDVGATAVILGAVAFGQVLSGWQQTATILVNGGVLLLCGACYLLNLRGWTQTAGLIFLAVITCLIALSDDLRSVVKGESLFAFALPIILASALLRPYASFLAAAAVDLFIALASVRGLHGELNPTVMAGFMGVALVSWLIARSLESALASQRHQVSARVSAEKKLKTELDFSSTIISSAGEGILVCDEELRLLVWNLFMQGLSGLGESQVLGRSVAEILHLGGDRGTENFLRKALSGAAVFAMELPFKVPATGKAGWVEVDMTPRYGPEGHVSGVIGLVRDITQHRKLEQQLLQAQKMEAIGRLAGGVAHDFNNMLMVIVGYCELVLLHVRGQELLEHSLQEILSASQRASALTGQLLAFSRQQVFRLAVIDLNAVLRDMESMLHRLIGENIRLELELGAKPGRVKADPNQLQQVVMNLAVNARDAMPDGGNLWIRTHAVLLEQAHAESGLDAPQGRYVVLEVTDSGIGMEESTRLRLFEPFFTTKDTGKGTGLGLSTTYGIVRQSGGFILVHSEPGQGSTFKVHLPETDEVGQALPAASPQPAPVRAWETVLVVEDDSAVRVLMKTILESHGYNVLAASGGDEAIRLIGENPAVIHVLLVDVIMPGMSGREVARRVTQLRPTVKAIYLSGYTADVIAHHGMLEPGIDFLQKPFSESHLLGKLREVLSR